MLWVFRGRGGLLPLVLGAQLGMGFMFVSEPVGFIAMIPLGPLYWLSLADVLDHRLESAITIVALAALAAWVVAAWILSSIALQVAFPAGAGAAGLVAVTLWRRAIARREATNPAMLHSHSHGEDREE